MTRKNAIRIVFGAGALAIVSLYAEVQIISLIQTSLAGSADLVVRILEWLAIDHKGLLISALVALFGGYHWFIRRGQSET